MYYRIKAKTNKRFLRYIQDTKETHNKRFNDDSFEFTTRRNRRSKKRITAEMPFFVENRRHSYNREVEDRRTDYCDSCEERRDGNRRRRNKSFYSKGKVI